MSSSLRADGAVRCELSMVMPTSAWVACQSRLPEPAKITEFHNGRTQRFVRSCAHHQQRSASTRLDLPQPFGPTTPVRPGSIRKSVGSTKDLNPCRRRRVSFMSPTRASPSGNGQPQNNAERENLDAEVLQSPRRLSRTMARRHTKSNGYNRLFQMFGSVTLTVPATILHWTNRDFQIDEKALSIRS